MSEPSALALFAEDIIKDGFVADDAPENLKVWAKRAKEFAQAYLDARKPRVDREQLVRWHNHQAHLTLVNPEIFADAILALLSPPEVETLRAQVRDKTEAWDMRDRVTKTLQTDTAHHRASHLSEAGVAGTGVGCTSLPSVEPSPLETAREAAQRWLEKTIPAFPSQFNHDRDQAYVTSLAASYIERDKATIERCAKNQRTPGTKEVCEMCAVEYGDAMTVAPEGSKYACAQKSCPIRKGA